MLNDPFDRFCYLLVSLIAYASYLLEVGCKLLWIDAKYAAIFAWLRVGRAWLRVRYAWKLFYLQQVWRRVNFWLMLLGFKRVPMWAEIEQRRLEISAQLGYEIPRPPELEEGLRREAHS
jgi:hypothetical protein